MIPKSWTDYLEKWINKAFFFLWLGLKQHIPGYFKSAISMLLCIASHSGSFLKIIFTEYFQEVYWGYIWWWLHSIQKVYNTNRNATNNIPVYIIQFLYSNENINPSGNNTISSISLQCIMRTPLINPSLGIGSLDLLLI